MSGWDDYPPIFTAQYAAFYGAVTATVELPLPRSGTTQNPATASVNTAVGRQVIDSAIDYYKQALAFDPRDTGLQKRLMLSLIAQGRFDESLVYAYKLK